MRSSPLKRGTVGGFVAASIVASLLTPALGAQAEQSTSIVPLAASNTCPAPTTSAPSTAALRATVSASFTSAWNNIAAVQDGAVVHTGNVNSQVWATWAPTRPAQQWLQYEWSGPATLTGASVAFWHNNPSDTAGNDVAVPSSWVLQAWEAGAWKDVQLKDGSSFTRAKDAVNTVEFATPIVSTKLRAVFTATTDGTTYSAVGVSDFAVAGEAPSADGLEVLSSNDFTVGISRKTGGVYHLANTGDAPNCTNYVANPTLRPNFDVNDSRWLGDVVIKANGVNRVTGLSDDIRQVSKTDGEVKVSYAGNSSNQAGIQGFDLTETYALSGESGDVLEWSVDIKNTSSTELKISDLGFPALMNSWWNGGDQTGIYERNVARHSFVAEDGSYVYWQRPNGKGPYLVMVPDEGTSIEFRNKARTGEGVFGESDPAWEGLVEFYVHSDTVQTERKGKIEGFLSASTRAIPVGDEANYGFTFRWADDYDDMRDVLYDAGVVDVVSLPGMTIPTDTKATLAVRAKDGIEAVTGEDGKNISVTPKGTSNGYTLYEVGLPTLGENKVTVTYGGGRTSVLQYNAVEPIEKLIDMQSDFLVDHQQARNTGRGYEGAFLQWDMSRQKMVTWQGYSGGFQNWMAGGSDDLGLSPAAFLSERNVIEPDQKQIEAVDYYLEKFIWGYMQSQTDQNGERTYRVYHWYDGTDGSAPGTADGLATWRVMNYPHVWNTYLNMYRIAKAYPDMSTKLDADTYLMRAYNTMRAYFEHPNVGTLDDASRHMGSMGEMTMPDVVEALQDENHSAEAAKLEGYIKAKADHMLSRDYPFASEMSIDTTAFEATYTLAKRYGNTAMADKTTLASLASRGMQPLWYYYGSDNRHMGESWWNLGYETQLGAWQQQDYLLNYSPAEGIGFDEAMRSTYGAYLAGWSNINSGQISPNAGNIGAASWQYQSQKGAGEGQWGFMPMIDGWWAWSGESALGFWGGLKTASVNVVEDKTVGLYAYGGQLTTDSDSYTITPADGVRQRFAFYNENKFAVEIEGARYTSADVDKELGEFTLELERVTDDRFAPTVSTRNLPAGDYTASVAGARIASFSSSGSEGLLKLPALTGDTATVVIAKEVPVVPVVVSTQVASDVPANQEGWFTTPVSVTLSDDAADADVQYRLGDTEQWATPAAPVVFDRDGQYTLQYRAVRGSVPVEGSAGTLTVKVDRTAPVTVAAPDPATGTVEDGQAVTARFTATDGSSGVRNTEFSTDGGSTWRQGEEVSFTAIGTHPVIYRSTDKAGNIEVSRTIILTVAARRTTAKVTLTSADTPSDEGWYSQNVLVKLEAPKTGQKVQYRINDGSWKTFTASITVAANGTTKIDHRLLASNVVVAGSDAQTVLNIDKLAPSVNVTRTPGSGSGTPLNPIELSFAGADPLSGVDKIEYKVNSGRWTVAPTTPLTIDDVGDWLISYRAADKAGNVSSTKTLTAVIKENITTSLKASVKTASPGAAITLNLAGYARWDDVVVTLAGRPITTVLTDQNGAARLTVRVPADSTPGSTSWSATSSDGTIKASAPLVIK